MWRKTLTFAYCDTTTRTHCKRNSMQFCGKIQAKMDAKGRLFLPSEFRKQMGGADLRFVLRRDVFQPCLVVYPAETWEREVAALKVRLNPWNREEAMLLRTFMAEVELVTLDSNGRFIVPRRFMSLCGTTRTVSFIGFGDRLEIWDAALAEQPFLAPEALAEAVEAVMARPIDQPA